MKNTKDNFYMICGNIVKFFNDYNNNIFYWENTKGKNFSKGKIKCIEKDKGDMIVFFTEVEGHLSLEIVDINLHKHWWVVNEVPSKDWSGVTDILFKGNRIIAKEKFGNKQNYVCFQKE